MLTLTHLPLEYLGALKISVGSSWTFPDVVLDASITSRYSKPLISRQSMGTASTLCTDLQRNVGNISNIATLGYISKLDVHGNPLIFRPQPDHNNHHTRALIGLILRFRSLKSNRSPDRIPSNPVSRRKLSYPSASSSVVGQV